ncbi:hypothetical protein MH1LPH_21170 [Lactiplantibacillus brownii]
MKNNTRLIVLISLSVAIFQYLYIVFISPLINSINIRASLSAVFSVVIVLLIYFVDKHYR